MASAGSGTRSRTGHADVRGALRAATLREIDDVGLDRASLRSIGRRVGMSHQAIAYYFADRTALFTAVAITGWTTLADEVEAAVDRQRPEAQDAVPGASVVAVGRSYLRFAREHRSLFGLMFASEVLDPDDPDLVTAQTRVWLLHLRTVEGEVRRGWGGGVRADSLALATFSLGHGLVSIERDLPLVVRAGANVDDVLEVVNRAIIG